MNLDDESYLSAYLDDELDPADRRAIEWSVESSPPMAEQLRMLVEARDAVACLGRPVIPGDLAPIVGARLHAKRRQARNQLLARSARIALVGSGLSAIAASLIFALILLNHSLHPTTPLTVADADARQPGPSNPRVIKPTKAVEVVTSPAQVVPVEVALTAPASTSPPTPIALAKPEPPAPATTDPAMAGVARIQEDRRRVARMLERPHIRRIVIVTDMIDAADRVKDLISQDARKSPEFGKITIIQELLVDLDQAGEAEVFAVPMEERGRRSFTQRLSRDFPNLVEERWSKPDLIAPLTELGQIAIFRGAEAAPLGDPPRDVRHFIANRADTSTEPIVHATGNVEVVGGPSKSSSRASDPLEAGDAIANRQAEVLVAIDPATRPDFVGPRDPNWTPPLRPGDPITVLVWVIRPSGSRPVPRAF